MSFQVTIQEVNIENVVKGKARYSVATVAYNYNGEARTAKVMSFVNPDVFKVVSHLKSGEVVAITATKNDAGYSQWAKVEPVSKDEVVEQTASVPGTKTPGKVIGSTYETPQERADNRVRIVRQSSLSNAIATLSVGAKALNPDDVITVAKQYFDWVYETEQSQDEAGTTS